MNVGELIKLLQQYPEDMKIEIIDENNLKNETIRYHCNVEVDIESKLQLYLA
jgi:hypothetical protein